VAHAEVLDADLEVHRVVAADPDPGELGGRAAGVLELDRDPDAAQPPACARRGAPAGKAMPVDRPEPEVEAALEAGRRIDRAGRRAPGISDGAIRLRRRSSMRQIPVWRAAASTRRSSR
jgi:hypothetical protein